MKTRFGRQEVNLGWIVSLLLPLILFWGVLLSKIPYSFSQYFSVYSLGMFLFVLILYYLFFRLPDNYGFLAGFGLTMALFALALSYKWTSGFSDNMVIGGLLPYKDSKNYFYGAHLILNGLPMINAGQSTERPLFPGFLSSLLTLTDQNLKVVLAIMTQLAGIGLYLSVRQIRSFMGALSASLYGALMYFYVQTLIGYTLSELLGFMLGCFAFILVLHASHNLRWFDLTLGLIALLLAVSARAGAFLIFPMLIIWAGWVFRGEKSFSMRKAVYVFVIILAGYFLVNTIYARLLGIPGGSAFGNFSYALYGQVKGGAGWHSAIEELGTRDASIVYRAALEYFLEHPVSLLIGFAKSYRDFFLPGDLSIFVFNIHGWRDWPNFIMWMGIMALLLRGFRRLLKDIRLDLPSLLVAGFIGVILSIPFLPPVDGGARFHASTMPFLFVLPAFGVAQFSKETARSITTENDLRNELLVSRILSLTLIVLTLIVPVAIYTFSQKPAYTVPSCPSQQKPFVVEIHQGSYIDLIKDGATSCGFIPEVCLNDFEKNNTEKSIDDYYRHLLLLAESNDAGLRIIPAMDLVGGKFHYFYVFRDNPSSSSPFGLISGCATEIETKNQSIYQVESAAPNVK